MKKQKAKLRRSPRIAISMGDPAGIGPEIALKALLSPRFPRGCVPLIVGDIGVLRQAARFIKRAVDFNVIPDPSAAVRGAINVLDLNLLSPGDFAVGRVQASCGKAAYEYILRGLELTVCGDADALVTNPINKEAFHKAGIDFPGHTELLAEKTGTKEYSMMFYLEGVCVAHVTTHCALRDAITLISKKRVLTNIRLLNATIRGLGIKSPRIAVGGLNPHAGENGLFGTEEQEHITPAISQAKASGINASGPYPPDTVFMRAFKGEFDGVVAMLHDHGFVALKSRNFDDGVNITIGLPIIRTSPGHGTAFDKAGKGTASENGLLAALRSALMLCATGNR
jgi:4-hydroxythreonine-4-phosphate dehydrogenase